MRLGIGAPMVAIAFVVTFLDAFEKLHEWVMSIPAAVCGLLHFLMPLFHSLPGDYTRSATALMLLYIFFFLGVRLTVALLVALAHLLGWHLCAIFIEGQNWLRILYNDFWLLSTVTIGMLSLFATEVLSRRSFAQARLLADERAQSERLLLNVLPARIAEELRAVGSVKPAHLDSVAVLFTDFCSFTRYAETMTSAQLVEELDGCFTQFDAICRRYRMEKLKTIGDAYMCAGGLPEPNRTHCVDACLAALEMRTFMKTVRELKLRMGVEFWDMRIGIHVGPVQAGVVGAFKFTYDIWGDTVNTASRVESAALPGQINVTRAVVDLAGEFFEFTRLGLIEAKNKGRLEMFTLDGRR